jgi:hypothetical protein
MRADVAVTRDRPPTDPIPVRRTALRSLGGWLRRHPALAVLLLALVCRVVAAVVLNTAFHGSVFEDDSTYSLLAEQRANGATAQWDAYTRTLYDTTWTFSGPLALLYKVFGPSVLLGQLLAAAFGAATAGLVTRTAQEVVPTRWAVAAGAVVALLPSQVLFSSLVLKDAAVWAVLAGLALTSAVLGRSTGRRAVALIAGLTLLLFLLGHLRVHTLVAASWAAALAACFGVAELRRRRAGAVAVVALVLPWLFALGPAGLGLVLDAQGTLEARRQANAVGASTAVVPTPGPSSGAGSKPAARPRAAAENAAANLRYLPRGLEVMLLEPLRPSSNRRVQLALAENLLWWPLLLLGVVGLWAARGRMRVLAFPILVAGAIAVLYGLSEGNLGTAFRHRGEIVWAVALLACVGAAQVAARRRASSD